MKYIALCLILLPASANAQSDSNVQWFLSIKTPFDQTTYNVSRNGGKIGSDIGMTCVQDPLRHYRDNDRNVFEEASITCKVGIISEVSLVQSCMFNRHDQSFGALKVKDGMNNYTISLGCGS
jgi:hypothetical protein